MLSKIGIGIIVLTFIVSLNIYLLLFTIPFFVLGALLVWFSKKKILTKTLWTVLPVILWYPSYLTFYYLLGTIGTATAQKFDFIFPNGFKGSAIVVGNISCGQPIKIKDGREQLLFPSNGVLLYQGKAEPGYINHKYYYQINKDSLLPLPDRASYMYFDDEKNQPPTDVVGVWLGGIQATSNSETEPTKEYSSMPLTVDSNDSIQLHYDFQTEKRFEKLTDSLIRDCEKKKLHLK